MGFKLKSIDKGWDELRKTVRSLKQRGAYVKVGVMGKKGASVRQSGDTAPLTNVDLAFIAEFGSRTQPARPFVGDTFEKGKDAYREALRKGLEKVYENRMDVKTLLGLVGAKMASDIKARVMTGSDFAPNAPSTVKKKGSDRPLVDTGRLIGSVTWQVVDGEDT